jgi:hypothetical protein
MSKILRAFVIEKDKTKVISNKTIIENFKEKCCTSNLIHKLIGTNKPNSEKRLYLFEK